MMIRQKWPPNRIEAFRKMWDADVPARIIADHFGIKPKSVTTARLRFGFAPRNTGGVRPKPVAAIVRHPVPCTTTTIKQSGIPWPDRKQLMARR